MKKIVTLILSIMLFANVFAQKLTKKIQSKTAEIEKGNLISNEAFDKMIVKDITYAIFGESTPTTGFKTDLSKPDATISGLLTFKKIPTFLIGFEFKGGATDKNFNIFKGDGTFNTAFEFRPSFHFILNRNRASYNNNELNKKLIYYQNQKAYRQYVAQIDTFRMYSLVCSVYYKLSNTKNTFNYNIADNDTSKEQIEILKYIIRDLNKKQALNGDTTKISQLINNITVATTDSYDMSMYQKYKLHSENIEKNNDNYLDKQISNAEKAWTKKKYRWITFSPFIRTEKINQYYNKIEDRDTSYLKADYKLYGGAGLFYNLLVAYPNKVTFYLKTGVNLSLSNNLISLSSYTYQTTDSFFTYGKSVTTKTKTGTAYNNTDIKNAFLGQFTADFYILPVKSFIPGIYFSSNLNISSMYTLPTIAGRSKDKVILGFEAGPVFNVNNRDKDKSIISISAYVRFEDITDKLRTTSATETKPEKLETKDDFLKRNLSFGVKVGIPITLPPIKG